MSTTMCSPSTICTAPSPPLARPTPTMSIRLIRSLDDYERTGSGDNRQVTAEVGRRLIDGALAFAGGDYARAVEAILPVRGEAIRIGGSHAQRDIVNLTLIAAAERSRSVGPGAGAPGRARPCRPTPRTEAQHRRTLGPHSATAAPIAIWTVLDRWRWPLRPCNTLKKWESYAAEHSHMPASLRPRTALRKAQRIRSILIQLGQRRRRARDAGDRGYIRRPFV